MTYDKGQFERMMAFEEGRKFKPYRDHLGFQTIGIGRNLDAVGLRPGEEQVLFWNDVADCERALDRSCPWWREMTNIRQQAVLSMAFQLGPAGFLGFKQMIAALQAQDYRAAFSNALASKWAREDTPERADRVANMILKG